MPSRPKKNLRPGTKTRKPRKPVKVAPATIKEVPNESASVTLPRKSLPIRVYELKESRSADSDAGGDHGFFEGTLDRVRIQYLLGDWEGLAAMDLAQIQNDPSRGKLALFAGFGQVQIGNPQLAKRYLDLAREWGCDNKLMARVLVLGAHASLFKIARVCGNETKAGKHADLHRALSFTSKSADDRGVFLSLAAGGSLPPGSHLFLTQPGRKPEVEVPEVPFMVRQLVETCLKSNDIPGEISRTLRFHDLTNREKFVFFDSVADHYRKSGDKVSAINYLSEAGSVVTLLDAQYQCHLIKRFLAVGAPQDALNVLLQTAVSSIGGESLTPQDRTSLKTAYDRLQHRILNVTGHGHEVLLSFMQNHMAEIRSRIPDRRPVLVEIGTTRENTASQGSTARLASFCQKEDLHFITVDMDPANTELANQMFRSMNTTFEAVHGKGEDFLKEFTRPFDFCFLDAYDFDHGNHSELRQSRYVKFLGERIDDQQCHKMHLECAEAVAAKISDHGVVCMDDTWLDNGKWTAKGTLAVPYLLSHHFALLEVRNQSALLARDAWFQ